MIITECPREMIQGMRNFIPTELKIKYLNTLLRVGFDTLDFGSFVSPKAVPQMKDIFEVVEGLYLSDTNTKLSGLVANQKGFENLSKFDDIKIVEFPFSISNTFLKLNINSNIDGSISILDDIIDHNKHHNKTILVYISMGFGNPYGDDWNIDILLDYIDVLNEIDINDINISDTIGIASPEVIKKVFKSAIKEYPDINFGLHLHTEKENWYNKIKAAYEAGVRIFDGVIGGYGGCPTTGYELVGNMNTNNLLDFCYDNNVNLKLNKMWYDKSVSLSREIIFNYS